MVSSRENRSEIIRHIENSDPLFERIKILNEFEQRALISEIAMKYELSVDRGWWWELNSNMTKEEISQEDKKYHDNSYLYNQLGGIVYFIAARDTFPDQWIILKCNVEDLALILEIFHDDIEYYLFSSDISYGILNSNEGYLRILNIKERNVT